MDQGPGSSKSSLPGWLSSQEYQVSHPSLKLEKFDQITDLLLERPNLNSSHLFRADITFDSAAKLRTVTDKDQQFFENYRSNKDRGSNGNDAVLTSQASAVANVSEDNHSSVGADSSQPSNEINGESQNVVPYEFTGYTHRRTVIRKLIPRKPQVDRILEQSCFIYANEQSSTESSAVIVVYVPHATSADDMPWYHPQVRALAYQYESRETGGMLSIHYKDFQEAEDPIPNRLHRTFLSLLQTFVRLCKLDTPTANTVPLSVVPTSARPVNAAALKDTILPQHTVQNTYTRLKQTYAPDLIARWIEKTEPSKHVFEDLSIAAFLIELWKTMYQNENFPGFIDIACGNGVLVYILIKEGYQGRGFDARKRKTWEILGIEQHLEEMLCIPQPFLDILKENEVKDALGNVRTHNGVFDSEVFVISNHADELTPWTPILAAISGVENSLPFLAIPCCSHALSGARHRYLLKDVGAGLENQSEQDEALENEDVASGDLKALRAQKLRAAAHGNDKSAYACLTKKTVALAEELGFETEMTLMRIPSTRNIGIVGNRHLRLSTPPEDRRVQISKLLERECEASGGLEAAAKTWVERAQKLIRGEGRGKLNLGGSQTV